MSVTDFFIRGRQFFGFLIPGSVWTFSGLIIIHLPSKPIKLIVENNPGWLQFGIFLAISYIVGVAVQFFSLDFAKWLSGKVLKLFARRAIKENLASMRALGGALLSSHVAMEERVEALKQRVIERIKCDYENNPGFVMPSSELLFGWCKRLIREKTVILGKDLDVYEEEINLLGFLPLPLLVFTIIWLVSWIIAGGSLEEWLRFVISGSVVALFIAMFCIARLRPLITAEEKEVYESFLSFHLERKGRNAATQNQQS